MSSTFSPTTAELALVSIIFAQADPQKRGILTGDVAVKVFGGAKLESNVLGDIWSIADEDNNGWLPKKGVAIALRLMGWAQKGEKITKALVNKPGPLPTIDGFTPLTQHNTGLSLPKSPPPGLPPFTPQDRTKFQALFIKSGPANGLLNGEKARDVFVKSDLSNDKLLQIWNLADTQDRGALDSTDFAIAMYLIQGLMSGQLSFIPSSLPPGLYQQAAGNNQASVRSHMTGNSGSFSPLTGILPPARNNVQPQYTGQNALLQPDNTGLSAAQSRPFVRNDILTLGSPSVTQNGHGPHWDVTASEKTAADRYFDDLDSQRHGYIEGDVAVPFMLKSRLPGEALAQIWDLADINNDGRLTRDGFAVAMHLIQKKLAGSDIPVALPPSLVPPSMRANDASPFSPPASQHPPEHAKDLLWDDTPPATAAPSQPPRSIPQGQGPAPTATHDVVTSTYNEPHRDLLGDDNDIAHTSSLHDHPADIGNVRNQLDSTTRSLNSLKNERATVEQTLANQASQLSALQTQLSSAKAAYETETKLLATLRDRHSAQTAEMQKSRQELIRAESDLSALRVEKSEIEGAFLRDKEEARDLHRKMVEVGQQVESLKSEVEKAKKDAKQQKGLLAIAKKQLSSREAERAKIEKELGDANLEVASVAKEREGAESDLAKLSTPLTDKRDLLSDSLTFAASHALPISPDPSSPSGSVVGKSNNPFERLAPGVSSPRSQSPFVPFGDASQPTASTGGDDINLTESPTNDPFGFSRVFGLGGETQLALEVKEVNDPLNESRRSTPKPDTSLDSVRSPASTEGSDQYVTPPTTANNNRAQTSIALTSASPVPQFPPVDDAASHILDIGTADAIPGQFPGAREEARPRETDLAAQLKEIEVEDSDSESDSEDEIPLAELAKTKSEDNTPAAPMAPPSQGITVEPKVPFDDIFGVTPPIAATSPHPLLGTDSKDTSSIPKPSTNSVPGDHITSQSEAPTVAGVSVFDEAMGIIPNTAPSSTRQFTFDSAFDDNFDFANATHFPQASVPGTEGNKNDNADNVFGTPAKNGAPAVPPDNKRGSMAPAPGDPHIKAESPKPTFDEAFMGFDSGPTLELDSSISSSTQRVTSTDLSSTQAALPVSSPPVSPKFSSSPLAGPLSSTPRTKSPPPRVSSPKPRPSTSSSKDTPERLKEPPTRHSKLSIRLPFGKKKKQQPPEPFPAHSTQLLTPPQEVPYRTTTPGSDDDVEAVKQLTGMGFSRAQAVNALENHGYDLQKALNSLLPNAV